MRLCIALLAAWLLDTIFGDPASLPHPVVGFGRLISAGEKRLNNGEERALKGGLMAAALTLGTYCATALILKLIPGAGIAWPLPVAAEIILIFFCLAGTTLIREVKGVFEALERSLEEGRRQVARIVGRDTSSLSEDEIRTAALETLAENLSDGVIAPVFWLVVLGVPGMMAYKMVNTLDSMIGYRNERYREFGRFAARLDDIANWIPARITALLMLVAARRTDLIGEVFRQGRNHLSPNSGYPEAALALILDCRFGGPHDYFGERVDKPYIGHNARKIVSEDADKAIRINRNAEIMTILLAMASILILRII